MDEIFKECYKISEEVFDSYIDFLYSPVYATNNTLHNKMVKKIKELVLLEYDIIHSLSLEDVDEILENLPAEDNDEYDPLVISRIKNKLSDYKQILLGNSCDLFELNIDIDNDTDFSIYDAILSMINIEIIKNIKKKIDLLVATNKDEERFINSLKQKLKLSKIQLLFSTNLSELLTLYNNTSIDETPSINIIYLKNIINKLNDESIKYAIENTMILCIKKTIDELCDDEYINLDPQGVFRHLIYITQLEILISYMDKNTLRIIYEHLINIDNDKKPGINNIKKLMKRKIFDN